MKITEISITVVPSKNDEAFTPITLKRNDKKLWYVENEQGLHPSLIDLANQIQHVLGRWNG